MMYKKSLVSGGPPDLNDPAEFPALPSPLPVPDAKLITPKVEMIEAEIITDPYTPPGPVDQPPPLKAEDTKTNLNTLKQEVLDEKYEDFTLNSYATTASNEYDLDIKKTEAKQEPTINEMCRDWVRGTCSRDGNCRYSHVMDLDQLGGVYTFCYDFQNVTGTRKKPPGCRFPFCKYVHATVGEKKRFFRTGYLPEHVFAHWKMNTSPQDQRPEPMD